MIHIMVTKIEQEGGDNIQTLSTDETDVIIRKIQEEMNPEKSMVNDYTPSKNVKSPSSGINDFLKTACIHVFSSLTKGIDRITTYEELNEAIDSIYNFGTPDDIYTNPEWKMMVEADIFYNRLHTFITDLHIELVNAESRDIKYSEFVQKLSSLYLYHTVYYINTTDVYRRNIVPEYLRTLYGMLLTEESQTMTPELYMYYRTIPMEPDTILPFMEANSNTKITDIEKALIVLYGGVINFSVDSTQDVYANFKEELDRISSEINKFIPDVTSEMHQEGGMFSKLFQQVLNLFPGIKLGGNLNTPNNKNTLNNPPNTLNKPPSLLNLNNSTNPTNPTNPTIPNTKSPLLS
jgi:hypothetical protein